MFTSKDKKHPKHSQKSKCLLPQVKHAQDDFTVTLISDEPLEISHWSLSLSNLKIRMFFSLNTMRETSENAFQNLHRQNALNNSGNSAL